MITNLAFSAFEQTRNGNSASKSEDGTHSATLYKNESSGLMQIIINRNDGMTNPRIVQLEECPEKGAQPGTPRSGKTAKHFFFRRAIQAKDNKWEVFRANLFVGSKSRLVVNSTLEDKKPAEGQASASSEQV